MRTAPIALAAALFAAAGPSAARTDVSALLLKKTQAFSDAGQKGEGAEMGALLDDKVVFFNEGGDRATKSDMASSTPGPPETGVSTRMTVTDWHCEVHGNVAVASFVDDQQQDFHGQPFHARYRSVETWLKEGAAWRMIASSTIALFDDPAAVTLPAAILDEYVGTYQAAPEVQLTFTRQGADLLASTGAGPSAVQKAEVKDVFFSPGRSRSIKVFERDTVGKVVGFYLRREGHDIHFRRV
ncbi:DUF4440 domain-containing protein [Phenylobacterium sp.]|uniref:nuclear transport factor 2 family protein n=1 Tax=Phenylobacterium sp. TaxID=1871053 RepID=UPI0011F60771|nr:DUF4440 domain-containing protein [Phenylobacterium sp.]THD58045.1 MAG: DUF4440 domain-containing protein [Phenylobacterium sp.]